MVYYGYMVIALLCLAKAIRCAKRIETPLKDYTLVGKYDYAKTVVRGDDFSEMMEGVDPDNCLVMIKSGHV
jgi:hypothetical protein